MNLGLKSLELKGEPTDKRDELLTTLAAVRSARAGGGWRRMAQARWAPEEVVADAREAKVAKLQSWKIEQELPHSGG